MASVIRDYHVHTSNSIDSRARMQDYCRFAAEHQVKEIVFTEHFDLHPQEEGSGYFNYDVYHSEAESCRRTFGDKVTIRKGLELGEPHHYTKQHLDYLKDKDFDFLLGSVHWVGDEALHLDYCRNKEAGAAYEQYFSNVLQAARIGNFDVLGHLDLLKRYAPASYGCLSISQYREFVEAILKTAVNRGIGLEVNTSGWRQGLGEPLPSAEVLQWYREIGGEIITVGSDSHQVQHLGSDIERAYRILLQLGFKWLTVFDKRKPAQLSLSQLL